ncbi:hypothetical protein KR009_009886 [Drosophila setifemur]|nr:hypothetical protein KR009_009886 [Drosophila setifemur]
MVRLALMPPLLWSGEALEQSYLGRVPEHRPLWILEDELTKRQRLGRPEEDYATTTRQPPHYSAPAVIRRQGRGGLNRNQDPGAITFLVRHGDGNGNGNAPSPVRSRPPSLPQRRFMMPHRLQLPHQYVHPQYQKHQSPSFYRVPQRRESCRHLPVFDNGPGENSVGSGRGNYPIFVYNGTRGELILNTMLSRRRYPMQEPVPGQVLYPPSTPMFRPKPIVERFRLPGQREMLNLTLIPFYAHEAIANPMLASVGTSTTTTTTSTTTTPPPLFETQLPRSQEVERSKRKRKKAKQYDAFHSPQEVVQWQTVLRRSTGNRNTHNHRLYAGEEGEDLQEDQRDQEDVTEEDPNWESEQETETEIELPLGPESESEPEPPETSTSSAPFQIIYLDESVERPVVESPIPITTPQPPQRQSSRYALKREYFAFPVYTLGKLLQPQSRAKDLLEKSDRSERSSAERKPSTWFILNSRYKGPHYRRLDNQTKYYTSKYIENGFRPRR